MKMIRNLMIGATLAAVSAFAVDATLLNLVQPDARVVSGVMVDQSKASSFGQYVLGQIQVNDAFTRFVSETGFDPRRDLSEIVAATSGQDNKGVLVIGKGIFNPARIMNAIRAHGGVITTHGGIEVATGGSGSEQGAIAFLDSQTALMGQAAQVNAAIDRKLAGAKLDAGLAAKATAAALNNDAWFVTLAPLSDFFAGHTSSTQLQNANLFQAVVEARGGVKFLKAAVELNGEAVAKTDRDAQALADVLRFFGSMALQKDSSGQAAALLQNFLVTQDQNITRMKLTIPEEMLQKLFMPKSAARAAARAAR